MSVDLFEKAIERVKYDLPDTFKVAYAAAAKNEGGYFNGGHLKAITPRLTAFYKKVQSQLPNKPMFNRYINTIFRTSLKEMKSNLFLPLRGVLDAKLNSPLDNFIALTTPADYVQLEGKVIPIYNKDNVLYIKLSDCDIFDTTPIEFLEKSGVIIWKSAKFRNFEVLQSAVEKGTKFWKYLARLHNVKHHLALYHSRYLSIDSKNNIAYFPKLRSEETTKDTYFGNQEFWYPKYADPTEDVYINLNRLRQFLFNYKQSLEEVSFINKIYSQICSELFSSTFFNCLEPYYTTSFMQLQGFFSFKRKVLNEILNKILQTEPKTNKYLIRRAGSRYLSTRLFPETDTLSYNEWVSATYLEGVRILKDINSNLEEALMYVRESIRNRTIYDTAEY